MDPGSGKRFRKRKIPRREFDLPEPLIQHIQSFLSSKEAARTTLLSKSWQSAWLTRPNLDFDLADFFRYQSNKYFHKIDPKFMAFAEKTLKRYEHSTMNVIDSFRLSMKHLNYEVAGPHATKLLHRALYLGPTRLAFDFQDSYFDIPDDVFRYQNLVSLTAVCCGVNLTREVSCSRLRFLSLESVLIKSRDMIFRVMSSCPLIEKMSLCHVDVDESVVGGDEDFTTISCRKLTSLVLDHVALFDVLFLDDLSYKFPSLKDLTLSINKDREEILIISSPTLERLDLRIMGDYKAYTVKLDVPSIRKLTFECSIIPKEVSVRSNSRGWESNISVTRDQYRYPKATLFYRLGNFLRNLKCSNISLSLCVKYWSWATFDHVVGVNRELPTLEIENVIIYDHEVMLSISCYALFDELFRMCRPKVITQYTSSECFPKKDNIHFLGKRLLEARDAKVPIANDEFMYGLNDLKEARAQVFDAAVSTTWRDITLDSLADVEAVHYPALRFLLNWKHSQIKVKAFKDLVLYEKGFDWNMYV